MNLATTISIYAGGAGSGCNPAVGKCGRPIVYYHGTTDGAVSSIKKDGLRQNDSARFKFRINVGDFMSDRYVNVETPKGFTYLTSSREGAKWYAELKAKMLRAEPGATFEHPEAPGSKLGMSVVKPEGAPVDKGAKPVVVTVELPQDFARDVEKDPGSRMNFDSFRTAKDIPADYVKRTEVDSQPLRPYYSSTDPVPVFDKAAWKEKMDRIDREMLEKRVADTKRDWARRGIQ